MSDQTRFTRESSNGWDERFFSIGRVLFAWATLVPGEPWEGKRIGLRFANGNHGVFVRFGLWPFGVVAVGIAR